jgi:flagellar assembly protein FliH
VSAATVLPWALPPVDGPLVGRRRGIEDLQLLEREAWETGYAAGREAGVIAARNEQQAFGRQLDAQVQRLDDLLQLMSRPLQELDAEVEQQLVAVAGSIARAIVRRELQTEPEQIIALVRETISLLPIAAREVRVRLHPDDAALIRTRLADTTSERAWSIVEDPVMSRGGCLVSSENSTVDARVEQRLASAIAAVLGEQRARGPGGRPA